MQAVKAFALVIETFNRRTRRLQQEACKSMGFQRNAPYQGMGELARRFQG